MDMTMLVAGLDVRDFYVLRIVWITLRSEQLLFGREDNPDNKESFTGITLQTSIGFLFPHLFWTLLVRISIERAPQVAGVVE